MRRTFLVLLLFVLSCGAPGIAAPGADGTQAAGPQADATRVAVARAGIPRSGEGHASVRLLFAGDVMLGRGVAETAAADPSALLADLRPVLDEADLAVANLESPLTLRPHDPAAGANALEAPPASAALLAEAGFDAMGVANNHAGDAGRSTVGDTLDALHAAGILAVGGGRSAAEAFGATVVEVGGVRVALLAVDATGQGPRAGPATPGVAWWDPEPVRAAVARARAAADVVAVGLHGGTEYVPTTDPFLARVGRRLVAWGADVVWGHGPHVAQPIRVVGAGGRTGVVATSLGNLVFDQQVPGTGRGAFLEVLAAADGVRAFRVGTTRQADGPVAFRAWRPPRADAVALGGEWWTPVGPFVRATAVRSEDLGGFEGDVLDAAIGDPDADGRPDLVVAFRRPFRPTSVNALLPERRLVDALGRTAHVGLYRPHDLRPRWVAGTLVRPVAAVAACDGAIAVSYSRLNRTAVVAGGVWRWGGFGFLALPDLRGRSTPACADVDGDGLSDALLLGRSSR
jgi:poly-gamma-glutamate synthesis protein (capsule biosynthesis protein)